MLRWLSPIVVGLALVAAGCGGSSSTASETTTTTTETVTESSTTDSTTTDSTTTDSTEAAGSGTTAWASKDCQSLVKAYVGLSAAVGAASSGQDVSGDVEKFSQYSDKVPEAIRADVKTLAAAYGTFVKELTKIGYKPGQVPTADQLQQLQNAAQSVGTADIRAASEHLSAWTTKNCTK